MQWLLFHSKAGSPGKIQRATDPSESVHGAGYLLPACQRSATDLGERDGRGRARQLALESSSAAFQHETVLSLRFIRPIKAWHAVITWQISGHFM